MKTQVVEEFKKLDEKVKEVLLAQREKLNAWVRMQIYQAIVKILKKVPGFLKKHAKDPYMFEWVKTLIDDIIDDVFPDFEEAILYQLEIKLFDPYVEIPVTKKPFLLCRPCSYIRNWFLYSTYPYDMSFWQKIRYFGFWFWAILFLFPLYGVQSFLYVLAFLMIDKRDEYQLINYILNFKKLQFITSGVTIALLDYLLLYVCTSFNQENYYKCLNDKYNNSTVLFVEIPAYFLQILMVWAAFLILPCSTPKGKIKLNSVKEEKLDDIKNTKQKKCCFCCDLSRGGRLRSLLYYDLIVFIICTALFLWTYFREDTHNSAKVKADYIFCKALYGLLSFPFLIFSIPLLSGVLTKAKETGYNKFI